MKAFKNERQGRASNKFGVGAATSNEVFGGLLVE